MSLQPSEFLKLLLESQLLSETGLQQFQRKRSQSESISRSSQELAKELISQKLITPYQAEILLAGHAGTFHFGKYTISSRYEDGPLKGQFKARHIPTQHPVILTFFPGRSAVDLARWQSAEQVVDRLNQIDSRFLVAVYEAIILTDYRFVVSQRPEGVTLQERLPKKARLPWKDACILLSQVAAALEALHEQGLCLGVITPASIWVAKSGFTQLRYEIEPSLQEVGTSPSQVDDGPQFYFAPELSATAAPTAAADWYSFGCCLFRAITGRPLNHDQSIAQHSEQSRNAVLADLTKFELPSELGSLMIRLVSKNPADRIPTQKVSELLSRLSNKPGSSIQSPLPSTQVSYENAIRQFVPGTALPPTSGVPILVSSESNFLPRLASEKPIEVSFSPSYVTATVRSPGLVATRWKRKWVPMAATLGAIWVFCGLLAAGAYYASRQAAPGSPSSTAMIDPEQKGEPPVEPLTNPGDEREESGSPVKGVSATVPLLAQNLIRDDRTTLWQSPTVGEALDLAGLPSIPQIVLALRPAELLTDPEGELLIKSLGPEIGKLIGRWQTESGVALNQVKQLIVSLHANENFQYEGFVLCQLTNPVDANELVQSWGNPQPYETANGKAYFRTSDRDLAFVIHRPVNQSDITPTRLTNGPESRHDTVERFSIGTTRLVTEVADDAASPLGGAMLALAGRADCRRHVNLLFLRPALFNDQGQALMNNKLRPLNRELAILLPDAIQGSCISLHLDQGTYFEMMFAQTVDLKSLDLMQRLEEGFRGLRDRLTENIAAIPPSPFWDRVRLKFSLMVVDFFRSLRWSVENGVVIANSWLPPMAAHNLFAAGELALTYSSGSTSSGTLTATDPLKTAPQSLDELLQIKRDLKVANPPDLNLLMADLESEINDEFPSLPFQFKIRLIGPDLQVEGITQNQRPTELNIEQTALNDLLTQIMVAANPAKDITGASDPRCKLVWAIADDPDIEGETLIVITTRAAAKQKNYNLPPAFQIE